jgi:hypothetical protein
VSAEDAPVLLNSDVCAVARGCTIHLVYSVIKLDPGLQIELATGRTTYRARAHAHGAVGYHNTRTGDAVEAATIARAWFAGWHHTPQPRTMVEAAALHAGTYPPASDSARRDFLKRWYAIQGIYGLGAILVTDVTTSYLRAFVVARGAVTGNTVKKDMDTIRPILRTARELGWIATIPDVPKARVAKNPRVPFSAAEWRTLCTLCTNQDVADFMRVIVLGLLRPREVLRLVAQDIADDGRTMSMHVRRKTGVQHAPVPVRFETLREVLRRRMREANSGTNLLHNQRLFPYTANWFPRQFGKLLDATGLRLPQGASCRPRDSWSLRATGICLEIRRQRRKQGAADYLRIARWAGTSMSRIDGHYAAFLG